MLITKTGKILKWNDWLVIYAILIIFYLLEWKILSVTLILAINEFTGIANSLMSSHLYCDEIKV